jgi:hypothetical protein
VVTEATSSPKSKWSVAGISAVVALIVMVVGFLTTNRRHLAILYSFATHELLAYAPLVAIVVALAVAAPLAWQSPLLGPHLRIGIASTRRWFVPAALLLIAASVVSLRMAVPWRYRVFSEVEQPLAVVGALRNGRVTRARTLCESYLVRYPHRRAGGAQPDLICTQVLHLARDLGALEHYIIEQPQQGEVVRIRNVAVPYGFGTRHRAIPLLEQLSGGAPKTQ